MENLRLAKDMKYEALYWALGFEELTTGIFSKIYDRKFQVVIDSNNQTADFGAKISILNNTKLKLNSHKSFVILECVDKLLSMGYQPSEMIIDLDNEYDIYLQGIYIKCFEWNTAQEDRIVPSSKDFLSVTYESRLISGVMDRRTSIKDSSGNVYDNGIFDHEKKQKRYLLSKSLDFHSDDFVIKDNQVIKYVGSSNIIIVPDGVTELGPCLFWDNQTIEEVVLPDSLISLSGDTFYNCYNLKTITITKNVRFMGNNPFAGCPKVEIHNESPFFHLEEGVLYNNDFTRLIYYPIRKTERNYTIKEGTKIVGKHAFYLCHNLERIMIPQSVIKLENNPFSGCDKLELENHSRFYHVIDKVIYDKGKNTVIGCLNSIDIDELRLLDVRRISRNSFWNCKGIRKIILPQTLETIGYNPFVGCSNIEFVSLSNQYVVENKILYTKDKSKLVCYPAKYAVGKVFLPDEVNTLERGAFSGCNAMTGINLHNVSIISKTCFTNCVNLTTVYCSDLVSYIGEWAFAHCPKLSEISVFKDCFIDKNVISNSIVKINVRKERTNYVIESDNIHTLNSMVNNYEGKIKAILIDPPYNSKIEYIGYQDEHFEGGYIEFLRKRFLLSYQLLSNDGFLVVNIDKGELKNLILLCKSIFGKLVKVYKWEKIHPFFDRNRDVKSDKKSVLYEYIIICRKTKEAKLKKILKPRLVNGKIVEKIDYIPLIFQYFGTTSSAKDEIALLFGRRNYFSTPKPLKLMKELIRATTHNDSIVLDFFAGSGTVGHATVELNREDGGSRNYLLISNNESNICQDVTLNRMQKIDQEVHFLN